MITEYTEVTSSRRFRSAGPLDWKYVVVDLTARDAIPTEERYEGMQVFVEGDDVFILQGGVANVNWNPLGFDPTTVSILSSDTDVLTVTDPTLADDVTLNILSNVGLGVLKLDASTEIATGFMLAPRVAFSSGQGLAAIEVAAALDELKVITDGFVGGITYLGTFDPANPPANPPTDGDTVNFNSGDVFVVSVAGFWNFTNGDQSADGGGDNVSNLAVGDRMFANPSIIWEVIVEVSQVSSVNGQTGAVVLDTDDINEGSSNLYYTEGRVTANTSVAANTAKISADGSVDTHSDVDVTTSAPSEGDTLINRSGVFVPEPGVFVAGSEGEIQYNISGALGTDAGFLRDAVGNLLAVRSFTETGTRVGIDNFIHGPSHIFQGSQTGTLNWSAILGEQMILNFDQAGRPVANVLFGGFNNTATIANGAFGIFNSIMWGEGNVMAPDVSGNYDAAVVLGKEHLSEKSFSFVSGRGGQVKGVGAFVHAHRSGGTEKVLASGQTSINMSENTASQTAGHGALAPNSSILGGIDINIPIDSNRSVVLGGNAFKARAATPDTAYAANMIIGDQGSGTVFITTKVDGSVVTAGEAGQFRWNTDVSRFEGHNGADWLSITPATPPGGNVTELQFHDTGGVFNGDNHLTWDKVNDQLVIQGSTSDANFPPVTIKNSAGINQVVISNTGKIDTLGDVSIRSFLQFFNAVGGLRGFYGTTGDDFGLQTLYDDGGLVKVKLVGGGTQTSFIDTPNGLAIGGQSTDAGAILTLSGSKTSMIFPKGTDADRATIASPLPGMFRFNTDIDDFEGYTTAGGWGTLGGAPSLTANPITHTSGILTLDFDTNRVNVVTLQGDVDSLTITATDIEGIVIFIQDSTGGHNVLSWSGVKTIDGVTPDLTLDANGESFFNFMNTNGSDYLFGGGGLGAVA